MEAMLYERLEDSSVQCHACGHHCIIKKGKRGICGVRENQQGNLMSLNFGKTIATSIDPIEKKPIYHFLAGTKTYSFAAVGCNLDCPWCQNQSISQSPKLHHNIEGYDILPDMHVAQAIQFQCPSISYTYTEPTIFLEYAFQTMKIAKKNGLKNIWVSNGFMSTEALHLILPYLDAINIDYKGTEETYKKYLHIDHQVILKNLKEIQTSQVHLEVTTLLIPGVNDSIDCITQIAQSLVGAIGTSFIWHISRFFPHYQMKHKPMTSIATLEKAKEIGIQLGIKQIYLGNI